MKPRTSFTWLWKNRACHLPGWKKHGRSNASVANGGPCPYAEGDAAAATKKRASGARATHGGKEPRVLPRDLQADMETEEIEKNEYDELGDELDFDPHLEPPGSPELGGNNAAGTGETD